MGHFSVQTTADGELLTVAVSGECDMSCREELTAVLQEAVAKSALVEVNLAGVRFMDSSGLHCLVVAYRQAVDEGKVLYTTGATGVVAIVLDLTGVATLLAPPSGESR